jgi:hypothetical protein
MPSVVDEVMSANNRNFCTSFVVDTDLVFPNVQTCIAAIGSGDGARLHGVHLTVVEQNPTAKFRSFFDRRLHACTRIDLVGGIHLGHWTPRQLKDAVGKRKGKLYVYDTSEWLDMNHGGVTITATVAGGGTALSMAKADGSVACSIQTRKL